MITARKNSQGCQGMFPVLALQPDFRTVPHVTPSSAVFRSPKTTTALRI